jgi:glucose-1-phosphate adenylyltransferase
MRVDTSKLGLSETEAIARPYLASMGIYVFKYDRLEQLLNDDSRAVDFGKEIIPSAIKSGKVQAYLFDGYWEDIGTISAFYRANLDLTTKIPKFNMFDAEAPVEESQIVESILSDGCIITGAAISNSVVGLRSRISKGVRIDASFLMGADYYQTFEEMRDDVLANKPRVGIGEGTVVNRAIIDKNARIGSNVKLLNEEKVLNADAPDGSWFIRDGIILVPKNAVISDGTVV